ncbi:hypothetical protein CLV43_114222 [Umezawaea tangerina]|uniref:Uncharacterized protein n=2 Tax=Umezawaea tangerina TaxID=84725 RepID=A0A2T0SPG8_9PSEU|nr:hypothetical protein CLV43_114222 [Umezawaea tangerina]
MHRLRDGYLARTRLMALRRAGWTTQQISNATGIERANVQKIQSGRTRFVQQETERLVLAVDIAPPPGPTRHGIDPTGSRRRVQALAWMGWPAAEVAARAGTTKGTLQSELARKRRISVSLAWRVAAVYDDLWDKPGPSAAASAAARAGGFAPPAAWDDDTIDNPAARPRGLVSVAGGGES